MPFPAPGDLSDPGIEIASLAYPALAGRFFTTVPPGKPKHSPSGKNKGVRGQPGLLCAGNINVSALEMKDVQKDLDLVFFLNADAWGLGFSQEVNSGMSPK